MHGVDRAQRLLEREEKYAEPCQTSCAEEQCCPAGVEGTLRHQSQPHQLSQRYAYEKGVDSIVCLDGMQVVGACLAEELTKAGFMSINAHQTIYVITPELSSESQLLFRENLQPMLAGKHVLILMASVTTGLTISQSMECVRYYGGKVVGVSAIYSATDVAADGTRINALFHLWDLPDYASYHAQDCPLCRQGIKIDAVVTGNGYSSL